MSDSSSSSSGGIGFVGLLQIVASEVKNYLKNKCELATPAGATRGIGPGGAVLAGGRLSKLFYAG